MKGSQFMALTKRLTLATLVALAVSLFSSSMAQATSLPIWKRSECTVAGATWTGYAGINNDNPVRATVTALSVTNGVQIQGMAVGTVLGSFGAAGNLEGSASGIATSVASFTVTITLSWKDAAGATTSGTREIVVPRPTGCQAAAPAPTEAATTVATTAPTTVPTTSPTTATPEPVTIPGVTPPTVLSGPQVTQAPPTSRVPVPLQPTVLASTVTTAATGPTTLPVTGTQTSERVFVIGALATLLGVALLTTSYIGRPPTRRTVPRKTVTRS
jgi:hypothetical protein